MKSFMLPYSAASFSLHLNYCFQADHCQVLQKHGDKGRTLLEVMDTARHLHCFSSMCVKAGSTVSPRATTILTAIEANVKQNGSGSDIFGGGCIVKFLNAGSCTFFATLVACSSPVEVAHWCH